MKPREALKQLNDYILRSYIAAAFSAGINIAFLAYNFFLGVAYRAVWNLSICGYYFMLVSILTLQNTMIMVFGNKESMLKLGAYTSAGILGLMIVITVLLQKRAKSFQV